MAKKKEIGKTIEKNKKNKNKRVPTEGVRINKAGNHFLTDDKVDILVKFMSDKKYVPMKEKELAVFFQIKKKDRDAFHDMLLELVNRRKLKVSKRGKYSPADFGNLVGIFRITQHGFGFVKVEDIEEEFFIDKDDVNGAMHLDTVSIIPKYEKTGKRISAEIENVVTRATNIVVGTFDKAKNHYGFVIPDNSLFAKDIFVPVERSMGAVDGHKVVVEITDYGSDSRSPEGHIVEILGHANDLGVDILSIVKGFNIKCEFPERVLAQAEKIPSEVSEEEIKHRRDLRNLQMVTIDSEEAKDLDDAVSLSVEDDYYLLGVHIADVTHYVNEHSALDKEALERGTSVYLVDRVIPMLPHRLSNGICSLNENVDRLTLTCEMKIDKNGRIIGHNIYESVIKTNYRMTYTDVNRIVENKDAETMEKFSELVPMFIEMKNLAELLRTKRLKRGSVEFDFPEAMITLDENGRTDEILLRERNTATDIIEEFMLAANETVARHFCELEIPFVYRVHEKPEIDKIRTLDGIIHKFGYALKINNDEIEPKEIERLLAKVKGTDVEAMISKIALRSMQRAKYSTECDGHFGLACKYYCHFTSPIRRYPDLQIHRIIKGCLKGHLNLEYYNKILSDVASKSSKSERIAEEVEREVEKMKKAEFMQNHIGDVYDAVVSGITNWGIYVELANTIEGLVHISKLPYDYYLLSEETYELVGEMTGRRFYMGQKVRVKCQEVDMFMHTVDFVLE